MNRYVLGIDQSTQGTKALLFDQEGKLIKRTDKAHKQIINEKGWLQSMCTTDQYIVCLVNPS